MPPLVFVMPRRLYQLTAEMTKKFSLLLDAKKKAAAQSNGGKIVYKFSVKRARIPCTADNA